MLIGLNPEHYKYTKGKRSPQVPPGIVEYQYNMSIVMCLSSLFQDAGHEVVRTMEMGAEVNKSLKERRQILRTCDLSITIAANASDLSGWSTAKGSCVFYKATGRELARCIADAYEIAIPEIKPRFGGTKRRAYSVLPHDVPSVLFETLFMTNKFEAAFAADPKNQERISRAISEGTLEFIERKK
jgi:N-acetylmuramoyl-L-alanine amidase